MKTKTKQLTDTKVSDNGILEQPTLQQELESIVKQHNEAAQRREQHFVAAKKEEKLSDKCLGAAEVLERMIKNADTENRESV